MRKVWSSSLFKKCKECGKNFPVTSGPNSICSVICKRIRKSKLSLTIERRNRGYLGYPIKKCKICGEKFKSKTSKHRTCSIKCKTINFKNNRIRLENKRKFEKLKRIPKWLTKSDWIEINWAYDLVKQKTKGSRIKFTVDHIIPLRGKNISGLHCPQNLQIITEKENCKKGNSYAS